MIDNLMNKELKEYNEVKLGYVKLTVWMTSRIMKHGYQRWTVNRRK
jgi:hypothetical protein